MGILLRLADSGWVGVVSGARCCRTIRLQSAEHQTGATNFGYPAAVRWQGTFEHFGVYRSCGSDWVQFHCESFYCRSRSHYSSAGAWESEFCNESRRKRPLSGRYLDDQHQRRHAKCANCCSGREEWRDEHHPDWHHGQLGQLLFVGHHRQFRDWLLVRGLDGKRDRNKLV